MSRVLVPKAAIPPRACPHCAAVHELVESFIAVAAETPADIRGAVMISALGEMHRLVLDAASGRETLEQAMAMLMSGLASLAEERGVVFADAGEAGEVRPVRQ